MMTDHDVARVIGPVLKRLYPQNPDIVLGREADAIAAALRAEGYALVKVDEYVRSDLRVAIADEIGGAEVGERDLWCAVDAVLTALGLSEPEDPS